MVNITALIGFNGKVNREDHHRIGYMGAVNPGPGTGTLHCHIGSLKPQPQLQLLSHSPLLGSPPATCQICSNGETPPTCWQTGSWPWTERSLALK